MVSSSMDHGWHSTDALASLTIQELVQCRKVLSSAFVVSSLLLE